MQLQPNLTMNKLATIKYTCLSLVSRIHSTPDFSDKGLCHSAIYRTIFLKLVDFDVRLKSDISGGKLMRMYANDKEQNQLFILLFIDVLPLFQFDTRRGAH